MCIAHGQLGSSLETTQQSSMSSTKLYSYVGQEVEMIQKSR